VIFTPLTSKDVPPSTTICGRGGSTGCAGQGGGTLNIARGMIAIPSAMMPMKNAAMPNTGHDSGNSDLQSAVDIGTLRSW